MPSWLRKTLDIAVILTVLLVICAIPFTAALLWGFAWGLLFAIAVFAAIYWVAGHAGMNGGWEVLIFGTAALLAGLITGSLWKPVASLIARLW